MKQAFCKNKWLWLTAGIFSVAAAILQTIAVLAAYESGTNYLITASPLPAIAVVCALIAAVVGTVAALRTDASETGAPFSHLPLPAPTAIGFAAAAVAVALTKHTMTNKLVIPLTVAFLGIAALYSILVQFSALRTRRVLVTLTGFGAILSCILINAYYYFDISVEMNAPLKTSTQTALLFLMLYLTAEVRYLLDAAQPRTYLMLSAWTLAFGALAAIPLPVAYLTGRLDRLDYAAGGLLVLCAGAMILIRLYRFFRPLPEAEPINAEADAPSLTDTDADPADAPETDDAISTTDTAALPNESDREDQT